MCLPPLILAGIALAAGGAGMNYFGEKKADHAMTSTFNKERARQQAYEAEQVAKFQDSLNSTQGLTDPKAIAAATARRNDALIGATKSAAPTSGGYLPGSSSANPIVNADAVNQGKVADKHTSNLAAALASLGAMGDLFQKTNIDIAHNSGDIGQIANFMRGSQGVLQSEMDAAKQKGGTLRMLGGLAQTIGSAMLSGGMGGGGGLNMTVGNFNPGSLFSGASMDSALAALPGMAT